MKSLTEIQDILKQFEAKFGYKAAGAAQGSEAWFKTKLGVISASNASKAVAKRDSETRRTYMSELIAQVCTGNIEEVNSKHMDWGKMNEAASRSHYEFETGKTIIELPFVFKNQSFRIGCSPDGLITDERGVEIKCPWNSANHVKFLLADDLKSEWKWQTNFCMWVLDADRWDVSFYDPRFKIKPIKTVTFERDNAAIAVLSDLVPLFIEDMDLALKTIGIEFGEQWRRLAKEEEVSAEHPVLAETGP